MVCAEVEAAWWGVKTTLSRRSRKTERLMRCRRSRRPLLAAKRMRMRSRSSWTGTVRKRVVTRTWVSGGRWEGACLSMSVGSLVCAQLLCLHTPQGGPAGVRAAWCLGSTRRINGITQVVSSPKRSTLNSLCVSRHLPDLRFQMRSISSNRCRRFTKDTR